MNFKKKGSAGMTAPRTNGLLRIVGFLAIVAVTVVCIAWVAGIGKKAEATIGVVMLNQSVHKNQVITREMLSEYQMLVGEYEKFARVSDNGTLKSRIVTFDKVDKLVGMYAAYPLQEQTYAFYRNFITSRTDNTDSVLYAFPGKDVIQLDIGSGELTSFKTFLKPGDKLNIRATFTEEVKEEELDENGEVQLVTYELFKEEKVFQNIMVADMLNNEGASVLDIYSGYEDLSISEQVALEKDSTFQKSTTPSALLVALTPEELNRYYYYKAKTGVQFHMTLPQRVN